MPTTVTKTTSAKDELKAWKNLWKVSPLFSRYCQKLIWIFRECRRRSTEGGMDQIEWDGGNVCKFFIFPRAERMCSSRFRIMEQMELGGWNKTILRRQTSSSSWLLNISYSLQATSCEKKRRNVCQIYVAENVGIHTWIDVMCEAPSSRFNDKLMSIFRITFCTLDRSHMHRGALSVDDNFQFSIEIALVINSLNHFP